MTSNNSTMVVDEALEADSQNPYFAADGKSYLLNFLIWLGVAPISFALCIYALKRFGRLADHHRMVFTQLIELIALSQLFIVATAFSDFTSLECDPSLLRSKFGENASGNTLCAELFVEEREFTGCYDDQEEQVGWAVSMIMLSQGLASVYFLGLDKDGNVSGPLAIRTLYGLLYLNTLAWSSFVIVSYQHRNPCRTSEVIPTSGAIFIILSVCALVSHHFIEKWAPKPDDDESEGSLSPPGNKSATSTTLPLFRERTQTLSDDDGSQSREAVPSGNTVVPVRNPLRRTQMIDPSESLEDQATPSSTDDTHIVNKKPKKKKKKKKVPAGQELEKKRKSSTSSQQQ